MRFSFFSNSRRPTHESTAEVRITAPHGLHARVAQRVADVARRFQATTTLHDDHGRRADARSLLQLLLLGAACGTPIALHCVGDDADTALAAIADVLGGEAAVT